MRRIFVLLAFFAAFPVFASKGDLKLLPEDLLVVPESQNDIVNDGNGFHLFIKKKGTINSVLIAESTKDPRGKLDNFAYRAEKYNRINGDEIRMLKGKKLDSPVARYSLVATTVEVHPVLGECFHIYVPKKLVFGYSWTRHGEIEVRDGTFLNIRTFEKYFCDYSGAYDDNPFRVKVIDEQESEEFKTKAEEEFNKIAKGGKGKIFYSFGARQLPPRLKESLSEMEGADKVELVFAIDATGSMKDDFWELYHVWIPELKVQLRKFNHVRLGLVLYKDYGEEYDFDGLPVKYFAFTESVDEFAKWIKGAYIHGGDDRPEAVFEALYASVRYYDWNRDAKKKIVLIGDAEPHPQPRGPFPVNRNFVTSLAAEQGISLDCIIIMDESYKKVFEREAREKEMRAVKPSEKTGALIQSVSDVK